MSHTDSLVQFFVVLGLALCLGVIQGQLWLLSRRLDRPLQKPPPPAPVRTCAACGNALGDFPTRVDDVVASLVNRAPIKVTYFICQTCVNVPVEKS